MKHPFLFCLISCSILFLGAASPLYVQDNAKIFTEAQRETMQIISRNLEESTKVPLVVHTVSAIENSDLDTYAQTAFTQQGNGILLLICTQLQASRVVIDPELTLALPERFQITFDANLSSSVLGAYGTLANSAYQAAGITPNEEISAWLASATSETEDSFSTIAVILLVAVLFILMRSYRVSRKYRQKHLYSYAPKRKSFVKTYDEEAQFQDKRRYPIMDQEND